ncbi:hypothetical protein M407DRAFT_244728 [Tulasnella calospora MUT 4182]|uniref:Uncharacterized protein n=1 Tax=Tulasnella calospora MUT 4182 TaxID=1051891 RepID=A0A0C3KQB9_9AGAM|nr:hypothetical protein M407DRAFT_244728 [Tulasnella calospora MUT 4182]
MKTPTCNTAILREVLARVPQLVPIKAAEQPSPRDGSAGYSCWKARRLADEQHWHRFTERPFYLSKYVSMRIRLRRHDRLLHQSKHPLDWWCLKKRRGNQRGGNEREPGVEVNGWKRPLPDWDSRNISVSTLGGV